MLTGPDGFYRIHFGFCPLDGYTYCQGGLEQLPTRDLLVYDMGLLLRRQGPLAGQVVSQDRCVQGVWSPGSLLRPWPRSMSNEHSKREDRV